MRDDDVRALLDRAAGPGDLPPDLAGTVVTAARARRRRRVAVAAVAAVLAVAGGVTAALRPGGAPAPGPASVLAPADQELLEAGVGSPVPAERIVAAGRAGDESIVALDRPPGEGRSGKVAEVWVSRGGRPYELLRDHLVYDGGCLTGDAVCAEVAPTGLGMYLVRKRDGRVFVLAQAPAGRTVAVDGRPAGPAPHGVVVPVEAADPWEVQVHVVLPDGRRYRLPPQPGIVLGG
ncbi:hypothetical protein [Spirilliplanes yamanashiensis]|uniref:Uncharacterized protein n=1 Tax=Spirilliplanes yamanashiensis TaxID=42233 RepID=A0A8J3YD62_9ACTN|nr:hypothetical protein [Spirilliplanes yamanashiensis]MDP9816387.1 hypothetical protein [Spirilliplanes yamanashiensis]GIJ05914.1 hypothetical protein Sya03_52660 [Spirilliplanes yamanashiensis]